MFCCLTFNEVISLKMVHCTRSKISFSGYRTLHHNVSRVVGVTITYVHLALLYFKRKDNPYEIFEHLQATR